MNDPKKPKEKSREEQRVSRSKAETLLALAATMERVSQQKVKK